MKEFIHNENYALFENNQYRSIFKRQAATFRREIFQETLVNIFILELNTFFFLKVAAGNAYSADVIATRSNITHKHVREHSSNIFYLHYSPEQQHTIANILAHTSYLHLMLELILSFKIFQNSSISDCL
ncbi:hypothetical protein ACJX0J_018450 [Zea mays]